MSADWISDSALDKLLPPKTGWLNLLVPWTPLLVKWVDWKIYLAKVLNPKEVQFLKMSLFSDGQDPNTNFPLLPHWMEYTEVFSVLKRQQALVQSEVATLSQGVEFVDDDLDWSFEKLRELFWLNKWWHKNISSILHSFSLVDSYGTRTTYVIPWNSNSKPWLLLLYFAWDRTSFSLNDAQKWELRKYFWSSVCDWTDTTKNLKYNNIANAILEPWVTVEITRADENL